MFDLGSTLWQFPFNPAPEWIPIVAIVSGVIMVIVIVVTKSLTQQRLQEMEHTLQLRRMEHERRMKELEVELARINASAARSSA
jgi:hypothetical protein